jgi:Zn-dependent protease with chaperone function
MPSASPSPRPLILEPLIHPKEKLYFVICVVVSLVIYGVLAAVILAGGPAAQTVLVYLIFFIAVFFFIHGLTLGHVRGNGIRVSARQFPEVQTMADLHSRRLGLDETPAIFVVQSGGVLNAFATRFLGRNFVVLYSDILALATQKGEKAVSFVVGHELGHVRRKHMTRRSLLYPAMMFPFLGGAYSRACEYTCDRFGNALEPEGGVDGLLVLAAGRELYNQVNTAEFINQRDTEAGFFVRFAEILSTHPNLTKRVAALDAVRKHAPAAPRSLMTDAAVNPIQ